MAQRGEMVDLYDVTDLIEHDRCGNAVRNFLNLLWYIMTCTPFRLA